MQDPEQHDSSLVAQVCDTGPLSRKQLEDLTKKDALLQLLLGCIRQGWPKGQFPQHLEALQPYWKQTHSFTVDGELILMGERVEIPESARKAFLLELHEGHTGISTTKALARMLVWWP